MRSSTNPIIFVAFIMLYSSFCFAEQDIDENFGAGKEVYEFEFNKELARNTAIDYAKEYFKNRYNGVQDLIIEKPFYSSIMVKSCGGHELKFVLVSFEWKNPRPTWKNDHSKVIVSMAFTSAAKLDVESIMTGTDISYGKIPGYFKSDYSACHNE